MTAKLKLIAMCTNAFQFCHEMDRDSTFCEERYLLPAWFIKRNGRTEAELAGASEQMISSASSCEHCKQSKGDDEDYWDDMREYPAHTEKDTSDPQPGVSAQSPPRNIIHHNKTFVELRDTILANFVPEKDGRFGRPQDFVVVFRVKEGHRHVTEPTWVYRTGVQLAKMMSASLVSLDFQDLEDLACAFYHQDQENSNCDEAGDSATVDADADDICDEDNDDEETRDDCSSPFKAWKPNLELFTIFEYWHDSPRHCRPGEKVARLRRCSCPPTIMTWSPDPSYIER